MAVHDLVVGKRKSKTNNKSITNQLSIQIFKSRGI